MLRVLAPVGLPRLSFAPLYASLRLEVMPVLPELVGRERVVRATVPEALAEVPKIKMILTHLRKFIRDKSAA